MKELKAKTKRWRIPAAALATVLALLLAACSGEADDGDAALGTASQESMQVADAGNVVLTSKDQSGSPAASGAAEEKPADGMSAGGAAAGAAALQADPDPSGFDRKIVYRANLTMEVADFDKASTELQNALHQSGGYILKFSDSMNEAETGATYTLKVPAGGFMSFLDRLKAIEHEKFERQMQGTDVSEEYVDLESRLKANQVVEARLLAFMDKATRAADLLQFSNQLASVQQEIERIKGRMRYLDANVAYSTIELRMYQPKAGTLAASAKAGPLGARMASALEASAKGVGEAIQSVLVFLAGALPVLLLLAVIGLPLLWIARRSLRARQAKPVTPGAGPSGPSGPAGPADVGSGGEGRPANDE